MCVSTHNGMLIGYLKKICHLQQRRWTWMAWKVKVFVSQVWLCATAWTIAHQASVSMGFSRQEYSSGSPLPSPGNLPKPGIKPESLNVSFIAGRFFTIWPTREALDSLTELEISQNEKDKHVESKNYSKIVTITNRRPTQRKNKLVFTSGDRKEGQYMGRGIRGTNCSLHFSCSVMCKYLRPHGLQHARPPCPSPASGVYSNSCPVSW